MHFEAVARDTVLRQPTNLVKLTCAQTWVADTATAYFVDVLTQPATLASLYTRGLLSVQPYGKFFRTPSTADYKPDIALTGLTFGAKALSALLLLTPPSLLGWCWTLVYVCGSVLVGRECSLR